MTEIEEGKRESVTGQRCPRFRKTDSIVRRGFGQMTLLIRNIRRQELYLVLNKSKMLILMGIFSVHLHFSLKNKH